MRDHIRKMIEEARRPSNSIGLDRRDEPSLRLASEAIRLARLAASTHMILQARRTAQVSEHSDQATLAGGRRT